MSSSSRSSLTPRCYRQGDSVIFMNFRPDRAKRNDLGAEPENFDGFAEKKVVRPLSYVCTAQYDETLPPPDCIPAGGHQKLSAIMSAPTASSSSALPRPRSMPMSPSSSMAASKSRSPGEERCLVPSPKEFPPMTSSLR